MGNMGQAKILGGIGTLLMLIGAFIPVVGMILPIVGLVLVIIAIKYIADETKDHSIFQNYLLFFILNIIASVAVLVIIFVTIGGFSYFSVLQSGGVTDPTAFWANLGTLMLGCVLALIIGWILLILGTIYLRKSFNSIAKHTNIDLFRTTGTVYFIGAITVIILVGYLIILIAQIIQIIAFFSLPEKLPAAAEKPKEK